MRVLMLVPHSMCGFEMLEVFLKKLSCLQCHHQTILEQKVTAGSSWLGSWPSLPSCQRQVYLRDMFFCCWYLLSWLFSDDVQDLLDSHLPVLWIVRLAKKFSPRQEKAFLRRTGATIILDSVEKPDFPYTAWMYFTRSLSVTVGWTVLVYSIKPPSMI